MKLLRTGSDSPSRFTHNRTYEVVNFRGGNTYEILDDRGTVDVVIAHPTTWELLPTALIYNGHDESIVGTIGKKYEVTRAEGDSLWLVCDTGEEIWVDKRTAFKGKRWVPVYNETKPEPEPEPTYIRFLGKTGPAFTQHRNYESLTTSRTTYKIENDQGTEVYIAKANKNWRVSTHGSPRVGKSEVVGFLEEFHNAPEEVRRAAHKLIADLPTPQEEPTMSDTTKTFTFETRTFLNGRDTDEYSLDELLAHTEAQRDALARVEKLSSEITPDALEKLKAHHNKNLSNLATAIEVAVKRDLGS